MTIAAIATPLGEGGIAVIRVSGPEAVGISATVFRGKDLNTVPSHTAHFGRIVKGDEVIDEVVATVFRGPRSYTGEDTVEISCHGGVLVTQRVLETVLGAGAVPARAGEFTERAFLNGKLDLAQAEAVADLIHARSLTATRAAVQQLEGRLGAHVARFRQAVIDMTALVELELDFIEEDVEFASRDQLRRLLDEVTAELDTLLATYETGRLVKHGVRTVIAGLPNAGKSTLLNALTGRDRAIVSATAGTTRDVIDADWSHGGLLFTLTDTAGLRHTEDAIEAEGVRRSHAALDSADLIVYLQDVSAPPESDVRARYAGRPFLLVGNKTDLAPRADRTPYDLCISAKSGTDLETLKAAMLRAVLGERRIEPGGVLVTASRHRDALAKTREHLSAARTALEAGTTGDFLAIDLRAALHHLGRLTGSITTEDLLDSIFSRFCIGK